jgi:hypothetical protein
VEVTVEPAGPASRDGVIAWVTTDGQSRVGLRTDRGRPAAERLADVADQVAEWLVEQLPAAGHPAVWPECPLHPGSHPLRARPDGQRAVWACPATDAVVAAVGELAAP